jgi:hypothetical protein
MSQTVEAEVIPPASNFQPRVNLGFVSRPGFGLFAAGVFTGLVLAGAAVYIIKKKL